jgi:type I restriction enzyme R subunit
MWLTGFDVECLATLYIDKPMRAHTLMQAIARANRRFPGKDFGLIVDYNGMLKSLREALAKYALGDEGGEEEVVAPLEERVKALCDAIEFSSPLAESRLRPAQPDRHKGFQRIQKIADAVEAIYTSDEARRRFRFWPGSCSAASRRCWEPSALIYAERHDNLEAIYKKLGERRDTSDVSELLKVLRRIVNEAIATQEPGKTRPRASPWICPRSTWNA